MMKDMLTTNLQKKIVYNGSATSNAKIDFVTHK